jgi:(2R)-ethylmalonyl-CoA mutase
VVGVNKFTSTEPNPLLADLDTAIQVVDPAVENAAIEALQEWKAGREAERVDEALRGLRDAAKTDTNLMAATLECARAGVTAGEWAGALREVFGEYRAPTGVSATAAAAAAGSEIAEVRDFVRSTGEQLGRRLKLLVGKPGLDGHSNGAEQIAVRARDVGFEVIYQGIRLTPAQIVSAALEEDVHIVGLSILSGSHMELIPDVLRGMKEAGLEDVPVVVGGIVPDGDARRLREMGVRAVFTPKDYGITEIMRSMVEIVRESNGLPAS